MSRVSSKEAKDWFNSMPMKQRCEIYVKYMDRSFLTGTDNIEKVYKRFNNAKGNKK
jgi:hypothetical protein